jgi:hypothetical protein
VVLGGKMMKRAVGIFLIVQAILTYLITDTLYAPIKEKITDMNTGITTVSYNLPWTYSVSYVISIIIFILGIYFILAKEKQREVKFQHFCD